MSKIIKPKYLKDPKNELFYNKISKLIIEVYGSNPNLEDRLQACEILLDYSTILYGKTIGSSIPKEAHADLTENFINTTQQKAFSNLNTLLDLKKENYMLVGDHLQ